MRQTVREALQRIAAEFAQITSTPKEQSMENSPSQPVPVVVVCGTAFIMAEVRAELGVIEPMDSESLRDPLLPSKNVDSQVRNTHS